MWRLCSAASGYPKRTRTIFVSFGEASSPDICRMDRLPFGASCSPLVAIYALRRIMEDAGANDPIISALRESMYVDDYLNSVSSVYEAVAGSTSTDTLGFKVVHRPTFVFTQVELIRRVASVFDPLGTASPLIVKAKIRLRELGTKGINWMDTIERRSSLVARVVQSAAVAGKNRSFKMPLPRWSFYCFIRALHLLRCFGRSIRGRHLYSNRLFSQEGPGSGGASG